MSVVPGETGLSTRHVLAQVAAERRRQDEKWGEQNHEDGTGSPYQQRLAETAREACNERFSVGIGTWADILGEEFFEAVGAANDASLREELVQVAAVATAWIEAIDRRDS